jgi:High potential iron-sulfur protein
VQKSRRVWLKAATGAAVAAPLVFFSQQGLAAKNDALRGSLKYQDTPSGSKQCSNCMQFVPGKTPKDKGGCKILPNDTEIAPTGFCVAYVELKK